MLQTFSHVIADFLKNVAKNTHREGYFYIALFLIITVLGFFIACSVGFIFLILSGWCVYFFRNPKRVVPVPNCIVSPADGVIVDISNRVPPVESGITSEMLKISVFLSVFDVHVNRMPIAGKIAKIAYHAGKFLNASLDKASDDNERNTVVLNALDGRTMVCVQIAGLIARRIVCYAREGQEVETGDEYGIIKFGSRVDLYLPIGTTILVAKGQRMIGGETIISL